MKNGGWKTHTQRMQERQLAEWKAEARQHPVINFLVTMMIVIPLALIFLLAGFDLINNYAVAGHIL